MDNRDNRVVMLMRRFIPYLAAVGAVAITTALISLVVGRAQIANISMLYLVAVSSWRWPSVGPPRSWPAS
jgi:K+-sensing histidine kinase KdpD